MLQGERFSIKGECEKKFVLQGIWIMHYRSGVRYFISMSAVQTACDIGKRSDILSPWWIDTLYNLDFIKEDISEKHVIQKIVASQLLNIDISPRVMVGMRHLHDYTADISLLNPALLSFLWWPWLKPKMTVLIEANTRCIVFIYCCPMCDETFGQLIQSAIVPDIITIGNPNSWAA